MAIPHSDSDEADDVLAAARGGGGGRAARVQWTRPVGSQRQCDTSSASTIHYSVST